MWEGLPVELSSHPAGHSDEPSPGDETWHLPQAQSVSNHRYRYRNTRCMICSPSLDA